MIYGEDIKFNVYKLSDEYSSLIERFECGNKEIDKYLKYKALGDMESGNSLTRIIVTKNNEEIIAYYSINCSAIVMEDHSHKYFSPSVEIKMFAVNDKYHSIPYSKDEDDICFSDYLLCLIIKEIVDFTENICGANSIILYSVPYAINFYERNGFELFREYMLSSDDNYLNGCEPMWLQL